jgi:hypothetical protein
MGSQKVCGVCMEPVLRIFDHQEGLNWPSTCLVGMVFMFMRWLTVGDRHHNASQDLSRA